MTVTVANNYHIRKQKPIKSSRHLQRTTKIIRQTNIDSSSTSPIINLSRSTSSIPNLIRPISPPCIQVKEPLSPKFSRGSSTIMTNYHHCSSPIESVRTTSLIDDSNNRKITSNVSENCFEPETYRNLYPLNSNRQKKLSFSDPTLNQTKKIVTDDYFSLHQQIPSDDDDDDDEIENLNSYEEILPKQKINQSRKKSSLRYRIMTCTNEMNDSQNQTSFHIMQNRPP
jgi:hypothetical protein